MPTLFFQILQGNVATELRWGGNLYYWYIESFLGNLLVKEFWKWSIFTEVMTKKNKVGIFFS